MISSLPGKSRRVLLFGATGTIGRATVGALVRRGHEVICLIRPFAGNSGSTPQDVEVLLAGATLRFGSATDPVSLARDGFRGERFDVIVSCLASRNGAPEDAWSVDYQAHVHILQAALGAGVDHFVLLSAICVQKPVLAFQRAKLAFEKCLIESGMAYTIVRPTAFFKSLSGQIGRVKRGKPFLVFGDGMQTSCKPISDDDLAAYIAGSLEQESCRNKVLPIGGPGDAITPRQQALRLFALLGRTPHIREVPVAFLDGIIALLSVFGRLIPALSRKAELARIGRYYATESMLVLDPETGRYDAKQTPSTGTDTLFEFYEGLVQGKSVPERRDHAVF